MFDSDLIAAKLRRWEKFLERYRLPAWDEVPDIGLYMEQVIVILKQYLDYMPPELKDEQVITASAINNYVRMRVMPKPEKKRYYRVHIVYLIMICSLKQGLSLSMIQKIVPSDLSEAQLHAIYDSYVERHKIAARQFIEQVRLTAAPLLKHDNPPDFATERTEDMVVFYAVAGSFALLLAEKLLLLEGKNLENGGDTTII